MVIRLDEILSGEKKELKELIGNKAKNLMLLKQNGFNVPDGIVLSSGIYEAFLEEAGIRSRMEEILTSAAGKDLRDACEELKGLIGTGTLNPLVREKLAAFVRPDRRYAVRSSGLLEDREQHSFAGLYESFLDREGPGAVEEAVAACYQSLFSPRILQYLTDRKLSPAQLGMAVIVQEMAEVQWSGVAFTVNPLSGKDTEMLIETAEGAGDHLVGGRVNPSQYLYDWKTGREEGAEQLPAGISAGDLTDCFLRIQKLFGHPCDIEFAVGKGRLYILQARAVTRIRYSGIKDLWSTADFKDGGVSAGVCTPFMWSLYEYVWNRALSGFVIRSKILPPADCGGPLGEMFYGRPYWNLSFVKKVMSRIPGYRERDFDATYGIRSNYEGDGEVTGITLASLGRVLRIALAQRKILRERREKAEPMRRMLLRRYEEYRKNAGEENDGEAIEKRWYHLTRQDYLESESFYFWQIFINTVHQSLNKDRLTKYVSDSDYLGLMSGISDISHLRPFYEIWEISRRIREDGAALAYWKARSPEEIAGEIESGHPALRGLPEFIERYGYHSDKELDVTYPCYAEEPAAVVRMFLENIMLDDACGPEEDRKRQAERFRENLDILKAKAPGRKYKKLREVVDKMREMLWWREEFRDLSSRLYYIIRIYTLKLAAYYEKRGVLERAEDIWMLKAGDLWAFMEGTLKKEDLDAILKRNRDYYESFRNYHSENEIGAGIAPAGTAEKAEGGILRGLGCNSGTVTARARVIRDMTEMDRLEAGDILVTKYTDTGWTCKFALLSGIVTEYGGVLCHAAIVSREYGIPCVVAAEGALDRIADGSLLTIDGGTGEIRAAEE